MSGGKGRPIETSSFTARVFRTLYRLTDTDPPSVADFLSGVALGLEPPPRPDLQAVWDSISTWNTATQARNMILKGGLNKRFIAELRFVEGGPIRFQKTFGPGHYTVWGEPEVLLGSIVYPLVLV